MLLWPCIAISSAWGGNLRIVGPLMRANVFMASLLLACYPFYLFHSPDYAIASTSSIYLDHLFLSTVCCRCALTRFSSLSSTVFSLASTHPSSSLHSLAQCCRLCSLFFQPTDFNSNSASQVLHFFHKKIDHPISKRSSTRSVDGAGSMVELFLCVLLCTIQKQQLWETNIAMPWERYFGHF